MDPSRFGGTDGGTVSASACACDAVPRLVRQSSDTAVYRVNDTGIKVLIHPNPSEEQILRLAHEQDVSRFLPPSCRRRRVIEVKGYKGDPAVYFRWARGETLAEWVGRARNGGRKKGEDVDLGARLRAAIAIVETLCEFHEAGVAYGSLSPDDVVLDSFEGSYFATLIDLSEATIFRKDAQGFERRVGENDLRCLGSVLKFLLHCGDDEEVSDGDHRNGNGPRRPLATEEDDKRKDDPHDPQTIKRGCRRPFPYSDSEGLPVYLATLISTLLLRPDDDIDAGGAPGRRYERAGDVLRDLVSAEGNPEVFLRPPSFDGVLAGGGRLRLPEDAFHGKQAEISALLHALSSVTNMGGTPMMASVSGFPGTGKTTLVNQLEKPLRDAGGCFVRCKFDVRARSASVIFSALDAFFTAIVERGREKVWRDMRSRILRSVGSGCRVLMNSIPCLRTFMGEQFEEDATTGFSPAATDERWKYLLCKLVAATSIKDCPLVIFFDDLQWADLISLEVVRMMATDPDIRYCLFVGVYRDNESSTDERLKKLLYTMQEQGVSLMAMRIGPIEKESVNAILSEALCLPPRLCQSLSTMVHKKTGGIALFVMNFLESLNEEGLLWFNLSARRWEFDIRGIEMKEISEDVVQHMSERMTRLQQWKQSGLKLSACLGSRFNASALRKGAPENVDVNAFLRFAVEGGYLQEISSGKYMWAHDQMQQAAYELIPETKRASFHLLLGSRMFLRTDSTELDADVYTIVGSMNIGIHLIRSQRQKLEVARLNLRAGEKAIASSLFSSAAKYLMLGITLLPDNSWDEEYDLTSRLYDAATEANYVTGDFYTLTSIIQKPLHYARSFEDKLSTYYVMVRTLISSGQLREAISKTTNILEQLGETLPANADTNDYVEEVELVKQSLSDTSKNDLLGLPLNTDEPKLACMQFMNLSVSAAYCVEPLLAPILVFRMVRLSISHGICNISAFAFGLYGSWLVSSANSDFEGGYRMGRLSTTLMNRLGAKEFIPRVYTTVYGFINIWKEPFQVGLAKLLEGYDAGALSGDMEYAILCLFMYASCALYNCGEDLGMLEESVRLYVRRSIQCSQHLQAKTLVALHELILTLMGSRESSYSIFFDSQEETLYQESLEMSEISICRYILLKRKFIALLTGDMEAAAHLFETGTGFSTVTNGRLSHITTGTVIDGLIALFFARTNQEGKTKWRSIGEAVIDLTRQWATNSSWNFINKLYLLEAEHFFLENDETKALAKYEQSIKAAHEHRFIHEEGLAFERAAQFHLHYDRNDEALVCFTQSKKCYKDWGAHALVNHIERLILKLK